MIELVIETAKPDARVEIQKIRFSVFIMDQSVCTYFSLLKYVNYFIGFYR